MNYSHFYRRISISIAFSRKEHFNLKLEDILENFSSSEDEFDIYNALDKIPIQFEDGIILENEIYFDTSHNDTTDNDIDYGLKSDEQDEDLNVNIFN